VEFYHVAPNIALTRPPISSPNVKLLKTIWYDGEIFYT
ncbi:uncharacterized protein METZ01_LOCUS504652, partial [marine metagenome]